MRRNHMRLFFILTLIAFATLWARSFRVSQIPNGSQFSCSNCHFNAGGGGPRNSFGATVEGAFLSGGNVTWNSILAQIDSDGDGFTNGEELQDPTGQWSIGNPAPGNPALVTNPGDPNSIPVNVEIVNDALPKLFYLGNNYPNPFNPTTTIIFTIPETENTRLEIFNSLGELVITLIDGSLSQGEYKIEWNGKTELGEVSPSGIYFYRLISGEKSMIKKMALTR